MPKLRVKNIKTGNIQYLEEKIASDKERMAKNGYELAPEEAPPKPIKSIEDASKKNKMPRKRKAKNDTRTSSDSGGVSNEA